MLRYVRFVVSLFIFVMIPYPDKVFAAEIPVYELTVRISPSASSIGGSARIVVPEGMETDLHIGGLEIRKFLIDGKEYKPGVGSRGKIKPVDGERIVEIDYTAVFKPSVREEAIENVGATGKHVIDEEVTMLLSNWYPEMEGPSLYRLTVELPAGYEAISESDAASVHVENEIKRIQFEFPHPVSGITLVAGKYRVTEEEFHDITLKTFLLSDDAELAAGYIEHTKHYIELYESLIGDFPYKTFSVVENTFQTGYSFPTYTLLGSKVIRLPFIVETSLGHEILHQWFGNYIYVDYETGNWSEGLTTYLADHWYEHLKGKGTDYRKKILVDYMNYVLPDNEIGLKDFIARTDFSSKAVGYGKAAMVFHMLRKKLGDEDFFKGLRVFIESNSHKKASWKDIQDSFNRSTEKKLDTFFNRWIDRKSIPSLTIKNANVVFRNGDYILTLDMLLKGEVCNVDLPARVETTGGEEEFIITVDKNELRYERPFSDRPVALFLDENYDIMRRLTKREKPPVISAFTGNKESLVIVPEDETYKAAAEFFKNAGYQVRGENDIGDEDIKKNTVLILSVDNKIYRRLFAGKPLPEGGLVVRAERNPMNAQKAAIIAQAKNNEELKAALRKIFRYGNYSLLVFEAGMNVAKEIAASDKGIIQDLSVAMEAVETRTTLDLDEIVKKIKDKRVIFVGEAHTAYAHHVMQYEIIRRLVQQQRKIMIGMEMFQRPFQDYLDQYIKGEMDEGTFLKKTEYFTRWKFEYNLYRDILHFARANAIPVIALNLKGEIITKVSAQGIDSLTDEEYAEIPRYIDMTNEEYREGLQNVFSLHRMKKPANFNNFFQSQILWDETMAHSVAKALEQYPDRRMVVLAGNGHLLYSWGIPDRVKRLTGETYSVIINSGGEGVSGALADYILFPAYMAIPESPKMGAILNREEKGVVVKKVMQGSPVEKAGFREGDIITSIDGNPIGDIADLKIILLEKKHGDTINVKINRKRFLWGTKEIRLDVSL